MIWFIGQKWQEFGFRRTEAVYTACCDQSARQIYRIFDLRQETLHDSFQVGHTALHLCEKESILHPNEIGKVDRDCSDI